MLARMRVKRLEIQGFKSFKDKTVVHFDQSITGIVGPNGCGKSNIVDAFFWVMGEQSYKHMRGTSSDDLIFNGSSKYTALGMAEATLVMEHFEENPLGGEARAKETSVTRRLYRTGEGEYLINGITARLKDIHELFMDTGVGTKGYSVIEQGQIGRIVNAKPEERRLLIEEAAGIAKYKARKKESLKKMEATETNVARLKDILREIEKNCEQLQKQAEKAKEARTLRTELTDLEVSWAQQKRAQLIEQEAVLNASFENVKALCEKEQASLQQHENSQEILHIEITTLGKKMEALQDTLGRDMQALNAARSDKTLAGQRQSDVFLQIERMQEEHAQLGVTAQDDHAYLIQVRIEESELAAQSSVMEEEKKGLELSEHKQNLADAEKNERFIQDSLTKNARLCADAQVRLSSLASKLEATKESLELLALDEETDRVRAQEAGDEKEIAQQQMNELDAAMEEASHALQTQKAYILTLQTKKKQLQAQLQVSDKICMELASRCISLEELEKNHDGLTDAPKYALSQAEKKGFAIRTLADCMELVDKTPHFVDQAIESFLEHRLESLCMDSSEEAQILLKDVLDARCGRVRLEVATTSSLAQAQPKNLECQVHGLLLSWIKTPHPLVARLLHNVFIVDHLPTTGDLGNAHFVDEAGMVLEGGTTYRGGSAQVSILGRRRILAELREQLVDAQKQQQVHQDAVYEFDAQLQDTQAQIETFQESLQDQKLQKAARERDILALDRTEKSILIRLEEQGRKRALAEKSALEHDDSRQAIEEELAAIDQATSQLQTQHETSRHHTLAMRSILSGLEERLNALAVTEAAHQARLEGMRRQITDKERGQKEQSRRLAQLEELMERMRHEQEQFLGNESTLEEFIAELTEKCATLQEELAMLRNSSQEKQNLATETRDAHKSSSKIMQKKSQEAQTTALEAEKVRSELSHLTASMEDKYGLECWARACTSTSMDTARIEELKSLLRALGEVNLLAIEEFETLEARRTLLSQEQKDLEASLLNLQSAIEHINETSEERFRKAFAAIAERFERLFPVIFGGGSAKLSLVYPEGTKDILDAGVDILAQPPGKKVSSITLLSGGEKALTAVSLIFAIFMVKPSPFCVLDEVDAPLDDANIGRFNALLREMSSKSQFILITHNKKTMELNDTLYGVTMEEPGVSKMVSIALH